MTATWRFGRVKPLLLGALLGVPLALGSCTHENPSNAQPSEPTLYSYKVVASTPHDPNAFTQGLVYSNGQFYEGTGLWGRSSLRRVAPETGKVLQQIELPEQFFGEGIALWSDRIIQLTWRSKVAFVYDRNTFEQLGEFTYSTEGWGLTHDDQRLIMSDGTPTLYFRDPDTFAELGQVEVRDGDEAISNLNELEYINGEVWANVWMTNRIARIDPASGRVRGWIDLTGILPLADRTGNEDVLNGIAYDAEGGRVFVTGKLWPRVFEIELVPR